MKENKVIKRDSHIDILLFLGIFFVVMGHIKQLDGFFFIPDYFHIALFFFISGYLFQIKEGVSSKISFFGYKIKTQLLPYFIFNLIFCLGTYIITQFVPIGRIPELSLYSFFIEPFLYSQQNPFMGPMWFLTNIFVCNIVMQFIYWSKNRVFINVMSVIVILACIILVYLGVEEKQGWRLLVVRTGYAVFFFQAGILIKLYKTKVEKYLLKFWFVLLLWFIASVAVSSGYFPLMPVYRGSVGTNIVIVPLFGALSMVLICYAIGHYINKAMMRETVFHRIGMHSFWIMALHLVFFFLLSSVLIHIPIFATAYNKLIYSTHPISRGVLDQYIYPLYYLAGLFGPLLVREVFLRVKNRVV